MKKTYEKPFAEMVEFDYANQVVAASDTPYSTNTGATTCSDWKNTNTGSDASCYHASV